MNLTLLTRQILLNIIDELKEEKNVKIIKNDILNQLIKNIIHELYPYILKVFIIILIILLFLIITIFHNLRIIYRS